VEVISLNELWIERYSEFLTRNQASLLYYSINYRDMLVDLLQCESEYYVAVDQGEVYGVLPLLKKEGTFGWVYNSLPFYGSNGGIVCSNDEAFQLLVRKYNEVIGRESVAAATMVSNPLLDIDLSIVNHDIVDIRIGQFTAIRQVGEQAEVLLSSVHGKTRNMIRKAQKSGIIIDIDNSRMSELYAMHLANMQAIGGKPKSGSFFSKIADYFVEGTDYNIYIARIDGTIAAALLVFYFNGIVEYYTPVVVEEYRTFQPLSLIIFQAMRDSSKSGYRLWNWGGTWLSQDGVYRFKKRWNTEDIHYYYYTKINNSKIYQTNKEVLQSNYDHFFVIPYGHLRTTAEINL